MTKESGRGMTYGVGVIGAGAGVAALHLPTLAALAGSFSVVHVSDSGSGRARQLADPLGARSSQGEAQLLSDPAVDIVLVCSPPEHHARQVLAAVRAGKRAILCEKPLALTAVDIDDVIDACRAAGTVLMVGTNHLYDPAWGRAKHHLLAAATRVEQVSVTLCLPANGRYHDAASEFDAALSVARPRPDLTDPNVRAAVVRQLISGLAVHDLPALRDLAPSFERVLYARLVEPVGYAVAYLASGILVQLSAVMMHDGADALWQMTITTSNDLIDIDFPPAFVHAGSARVRVRASDGRSTEYSQAHEDGYLSEWRALADLLSGGLPVEYDEIGADALYATVIADAAAEWVAADAGAFELASEGVAAS